jgi:hypothetical protein
MAHVGPRLLRLENSSRCPWRPTLSCHHQTARDFPGVAVGCGASAAAVAGVFLFERLPESGGPRLSTGAPMSPNREANEAFKLAQQFQGVQTKPRAQQMLERALSLDPCFATMPDFNASSTSSSHSGSTQPASSTEREAVQKCSLNVYGVMTSIPRPLALRSCAVPQPVPPL